ncbi:MAG TPA: hypothetical protein VMV03_09200, partial [Spirochaetia bacterium]|nr:hypothetical protein [Spirochaetia bacterium]
MKKVPRVILTVFLVILGALVLCALVLVGRWLIRHEDPLAFLPERSVAYFQVPSIRALYDDWLNLPAADAILARPDLAPYRSAVADARGLALTRSRILQKLMDVHADVVLLPDRRLLAVLDLGWRGIVTPLARFVGPALRIKGFAFLNDAGTTLYSYTSGGANVHAAFLENVAILSTDESAVREALSRRASGTGLAARASRELLHQLRAGAGRAIRVIVDTPSLSSELLAGSDRGTKILQALQLPGQSMLDAEASGNRLSLSASLPVSAGIPELEKVLGASHQPLGALRYVPSSAYLLTVSNLAPLRDLYRLAAAVGGSSIQDVSKKADDGARTFLGVGIDDLVFSWAGSEVGAFSLPGSNVPVYFARITDQASYTRAVEKITGSIVAGKDSSLVMDGVRIDRLSIPWYVTLILDALDVHVPEPYFLVRGDYLFVSMDAENLSAVVKAGSTGENILRVGGVFSRLTQGIPADSSVLVWYDSSRGLPFFLAPTGTLSDLLRVYGSGVAVLRVSPSRIQAGIVTESAQRSAAQPLGGFPLSPDGALSGDVLALRFADAGPALLAWIRDRSTLVLADAAGSRIAEAKLETDSVILAEKPRPGAPGAIWAVSPGGTVWRFGPKLEPMAPFPVATGIASPMPASLIDGKLALFSRADSALVLVGPDGSRKVLGEKVEAPLYSSPSFFSGRIAFYPKSFDAQVHLSDLAGVEAPGWPVRASGISFCAPRIVKSGTSFIVTFLTQAGALDAWDPTGAPAPSFPVSLPGV